MEKMGVYRVGSPKHEHVKKIDLIYKKAKQSDSPGDTKLKSVIALLKELVKSGP